MVGSVPLAPATALFCTLSAALSGVIRRLPDGEQAGWLLGAWKTNGANPLLQLGRKVPMARRPTTQVFQRELQYYQLKPGIEASRLKLGPVGIASNAIASYKQFVELKQAGRIAADLRFQVTLLGPLDCAGLIDAPKQAVFRAAEEAINAEMDTILAVLPHDQIAIQLDLAVEVELEEYRRRPAVFDMPAIEDKDWTIDEASTLVANIANRVPQPVELGFHLCSLWHIDQSHGQDNDVHVDWCNALYRKIFRSITYIHFPTIPEHGVHDFEPLRRLDLQSSTKLFLGVLHAPDGIAGARRRIAAAAQIRADFGIASFVASGNPVVRKEARPHTPDKILQLNAEAATL